MKKVPEREREREIMGVYKRAVEGFSTGKEAKVRVPFVR